MSYSTKPYWIIYLLIATILFSSCSPQNVELTGEDKDAVLAFSEGLTDNLVEGMNANDYSIFSADFDAAMLAAMSEEKFEVFEKDIADKFGPYTSREVNSVAQMGEYVAVNYNTIFEKDKDVVMRVVFTASEPHLISGLWFNK